MSPDRDDAHVDDPAPPGILVADDHPVVRAGVRTLLSGEVPLPVVGEAGTLAETLAATALLRPRLLVLDLRMEGADTLAAIDELRARSPHLGVLVFTMHDEPVWAVRAFAAGADAFVRKDAPDGELAAAARAVVAGRRYLDSGLGAALACAAGRPAVEPTLSERQLRVLTLMGSGLTNQDIARTLFLSVRTVEGVRAQLRRALGAANDLQVVLRARETGLLRADTGAGDRSP